MEVNIKASNPITVDFGKFGGVEYQPGEGIDITENIISIDNTVATKEWVNDTKQDKLTAGTNITIDENNVISAEGGSGDSKLYEAIYGESTYEEIFNALQDKKIVYFKMPITATYFAGNWFKNGDDKYYIQFVNMFTLGHNVYVQECLITEDDIWSPISMIAIRGE